MIDVAEALVPDGDAAESGRARVELRVERWMDDEKWVGPRDRESRALRRGNCVCCAKCDVPSSLVAEGDRKEVR